MDGSSCGRWHFAHSVVACSTTAGRFPCDFAWHPMHVAGARPGANTWQVRQPVAPDPWLPWWDSEDSFAWQFLQTSMRGVLNPSRSKSWQSRHWALPRPTCDSCPGLVRYSAHEAGTSSGATPRGACGQSLTSAATPTPRMTTAAVKLQTTAWGGLTAPLRDR